MSKASARLSEALIVFAVAFCLQSHVTAQSTSASLGIFESQSDVGSVTPPGTLAFDAARHVYAIDSSGANLWSTIDGFHFVWKKVSGDVLLTADITFPL